MHLTQVLSIAHRSLMERQNMSRGAPSLSKFISQMEHIHVLTDWCTSSWWEILLSGSINVLAHRGKGQYSILRKSPPTLYPELEPEQLTCLGPPFFPTNCPQQRNSPPSIGLGLKWKWLLQR